MIFERGTAPASITLNEKKRITGLWFGNWILKNDTIEKIAAEFQKIPGKVSVCIMKNNSETLLAINNNTPMAVGSTFKLCVLKAVYDQVQAGKMSWNSIIRLNHYDKSLPSGMLQEWADKTPVTLKTLTNLMISISDNTATDHLIDYIGRDTVEKYTSAINHPFLKTAEMYKLKFGSERALSQKYLKSSPVKKKKFSTTLPIWIYRVFKPSPRRH